MRRKQQQGIIYNVHSLKNVNGHPWLGSLMENVIKKRQNCAIRDLLLRYGSACCILWGLAQMALEALGSVQAGQKQLIYGITKGVTRE